MGWLRAAKSKYGHFANYHKKFGYKKTDLKYDDGHRKTELYLFNFQNVYTHKYKIALKSGK